MENRTEHAGVRSRGAERTALSGQQHTDPGHRTGRVDAPWHGEVDIDEFVVLVQKVNERMQATDRKLATKELFPCPPCWRIPETQRDQETKVRLPRGLGTVLEAWAAEEAVRDGPLGEPGYEWDRGGVMDGFVRARFLQRRRFPCWTGPKDMTVLVYALPVPPK